MIPAAFGLSDLERKRLGRAVRRALSADDRAYVIRHADVSLRSTVALYWNSGRPGTCWCSLCAIAFRQVRREYARLAKRRRVSHETVSAQVPA